MSSNPVRVSVVSYTNSRPFIYGLQHAGADLNAEISYDIPSDCAQKLIKGEADVGLVPVAALLDLDYWEIISAYCIGAIGRVNSVFVFSEKPIQQISRLQLDPQSRTSNLLARILLKHFWKTEPELMTDAKDYAQSADPFTAHVQIGDRTFGQKTRYAYAYDLAEAWQQMTGLPFVFAAWVTNGALDDDFKGRFTDCLRFGLDHRREVIETLPHHPGFDTTEYLMHNIDYIFDEGKKQALELFLKLARRSEEPVKHQFDRF